MSAHRFVPHAWSQMPKVNATGRIQQVPFTQNEGRAVLKRSVSYPSSRIDPSLRGRVNLDIENEIHFQNGLFRLP
jgi:hypothetical protein